MAGRLKMEAVAASLVLFIVSGCNPSSDIPTSQAPDPVCKPPTNDQPATVLTPSLPEIKDLPTPPPPPAQKKVPVPNAPALQM